jgi:aspartate 1-decarboxylase
VILIAYASLEDAEARRFTPRVVFVDERNRIIRPPLRAES